MAWKDLSADVSDLFSSPVLSWADTSEGGHMAVQRGPHAFTRMVDTARRGIPYRDPRQRADARAKATRAREERLAATGFYRARYELRKAVVARGPGAEVLAELLRQGFTVRAAAARAGVAQELVCRVAEQRGLKSQRRQPRPVANERARELLLAGAGWREVVAETGLSRTTVYGLRKALDAERADDGHEVDGTGQVA